VPAASRPLTALLLVLVLGACSGPVALYQTPGMSASFTDGRFKVEWSTAQTKDGRPLIAGYVTNTSGGGVANIRMQTQTLDAQGQVIDTGTALAPSTWAASAALTSKSHWRRRVPATASAC